MGGHHRARRADADARAHADAVAQYLFHGESDRITAGQPVTFQWSTSNVKAVYFYRDGENWEDHGVPGVGQSIEYPPYTMNYYLRVINQDDSVTVKTRTITVSQPVGRR